MPLFDFDGFPVKKSVAMTFLLRLFIFTMVHKDKAKKNAWAKANRQKKKEEFEHTDNDECVTPMKRFAVRKTSKKFGMNLYCN